MPLQWQKSPITNILRPKSIFQSKRFLDQVKNELEKYAIDEDFYRLIVEALQEEEDQRVAEQESNTTQINKKIAGANNKLNSLRRMHYSGKITDQPDFYQNLNH